MENKKLTTITDGSGREITLTKDDFKFVQKDKKIYDIKFKSKATTFFKDAMKRFVKSKSALTGGIIVGILILGSIIIPMITDINPEYNSTGSVDRKQTSVYNVEQGGGGNSTEAFLQPKLFEAGTGFWDGCLQRTHIVYDNENECPVGANEGTFFHLTKYDSYDNVSTIYGEGGSVNVSCSTLDGQTNGNFSSPFITLNNESTYNIKFNLLDEQVEGYEFFGYKLSVVDADGNKIYIEGNENTFSTNKAVEKTFNDIQITKNYKFNFEVKNNSTVKYSNILIKDFIVTSNNQNEATLLEEVSFKDGNTLFLRDKTYTNGYWDIDVKANKGVYKVKITYCDYTYDQYYDVYGLVEESYSALELIRDKNNGIVRINMDANNCNATTDKEVLKQRFEILDEDRCSFAEVVEQVGDATYSSAKKAYTGYTLKVKIWKYKKLGYKEMPKFLFGTNALSKDYLKLMFKGMRKSFLLAIGVSAVNIFIGLCWGSISGYFGGWTDIIMERCTDIIGGLPGTVIITLCILYGREFNWGSSADIIALMVALFMTGWMGVAHQTRTQFYRFKGREYVLASRTLGAKDARLIFKHILPNSAGTIITGSVLMIPGVIYTESSIAYLHLGLQGQVLFGVVLSEANNYYTGDKSFLLFIPTFIMMLLLVSFNLFGNGLRDAFNPALKGGE